MNEKSESVIDRVVHKEIRALNAYCVQPFDGRVKLDAMERPYGLPDDLQEKLLKRLQSVAVNRYPDPQAGKLKQQLRQIFSIPADLELTLGNGSDELLQLIQLVTGGYHRCIMAPQPSFLMYEIIARYTRAKFVGVDLDENFQLNTAKWFDAVQKNNPSCVFLSYPNNPTGNFFDTELIEKTARSVNGLVVVDEAYFEYSGRSMLNLVNQFENLVVVRTLSKSGLAGLRIGFIISNAAWAGEFEKLRLPYNIGVLAQASAEFALEHWAQISVATEMVITQRGFLQARLQQLDRLEVIDSHTNFLVIRIKGKNGSEVFEGLKSDGILVKNLDRTHTVLADCLRVTVGTAEENAQFIEGLKRNLR